MLRRIGTVLVPWVLASTVGILVLVHFFVPLPGLGSVINGLVEWATIIAGFAVILGLVNVARVHGRRVVRREGGWPYSAVLLLSALAVLVLGLLPGSYGPGDAQVQWVFHYILEPLATTFFSLLAFFLASAIFRALRLRNLEATLVTVMAVIVLLGQAQIASYWPALEPVSRLQEWLLRVPTMAGVRAILIGAAIGAIATALRILLGLERPYAE
jgi:hypothetical protein